MKRTHQWKGLQLMLVFVLAISILLVGCGSNKANTTGDELVTLNIGHATWVGYGPLYIAQEKGYFEKYGVKPNLLIIEDEGQYAAALTSGQLQGLANVLDREIIHFAKGAPVTVVAAMCESAGGDGLIATAEIQTVADLKGKTVGLDKSSTSYFFFLTILDKYGVDEADINILEMTAGDAGAAFVAGRLDAAVTWEPWLMNVKERDGGHILVSSADFPNTIVDVFALRQDFVDNNPEAVTGIVKAWYDAVDFYRANPDEGNQIMAKAMDLTVQDMEEMAAGVRFIGKEENLAFYKVTDTPDSIWGLSKLADRFWRDKGIITEPVDISAFIKDQFVKEAAK